MFFAAAGDGAAAEWTMGFKGGVALADLGGDDVDSDATETRAGFVGGAFAQADVSRNFGIRLEALYHMKGASTDAAGVDVTFQLDYFELPLLLVGQIPASESATFSAFAGPVFAFNASADLEASAGGLSGSVDISDYIAGFEFGLAFGLGASFEAGPTVIALDGRYDLGLQTVDDGIADFVFGVGNGVEFDIKNRGFSFMAGIGFPLGGSK
jgi:hypothetical protein